MWNFLKLLFDPQRYERPEEEKQIVHPIDTPKYNSAMFIIENKHIDDMVENACPNLYKGYEYSLGFLEVRQFMGYEYKTMRTMPPSMMFKLQYCVFSEAFLNDPDYYTKKDVAQECVDFYIQNGDVKKQRLTKSQKELKEITDRIIRRHFTSPLDLC